MFKEDHFHGQGSFKKANGELYVGEWKKGAAHGIGTYVLVDGSKYFGHYKHGERHGAGIISWVNGDKLIGKWKNGYIEGVGSLQFSNGDALDLHWSNGKLKSKCTYQYSNGDLWEGSTSALHQLANTQNTQTESLIDNLSMIWYAISIEYKFAKKYKSAKEALLLAQQYTSASSDLNKLIVQQLAIINKTLAKNEL